MAKSISEKLNDLKSKNLTYIELGREKKYLTGEQKGQLAKYADPLFLNFKLLINFDSSYGLFADEKNINSALAYLKRIGETARYDMLKHWIDIFKIFIKDYDFLILEIIGLDEIQNAVAFEQFIEENAKIDIKIRETSDMLIHSLIATYRWIWFDNDKGVEIIPINLRRFDASVLVFSAGYYNMDLYDNGEDKEKLKNQTLNSNGIERIIYPTIRKLSDNNYNNKLSEEYNHLMFKLQDCTINNEESGKSFLETVSNEQASDYVKNTLSLNFRFASYSGRFNNIMGDVDFVGFLALMAAQNKTMNSNTADLKFKDKIKEQIKEPFNNVKKAFTKDSLNNSFQNLKSSSLKTLETKGLNQIPKLSSKNSVIGNLLNNMTPKYAEMLIQNTFAKGINFIEQKYIDEPLTRVNNMLFQNFSNNLIDIYNLGNNENFNKIGFEPNKPKTVDNANKPHYVEQNINNVQKGIKFGVDNIYNRVGF